MCGACPNSVFKRTAGTFAPAALVVHSLCCTTLVEQCLLAALNLAQQVLQRPKVLIDDLVGK